VREEPQNQQLGHTIEEVLFCFHASYAYLSAKGMSSLSAKGIENKCADRIGKLRAVARLAHFAPPTVRRQRNTARRLSLPMIRRDRRVGKDRQNPARRRADRKRAQLEQTQGESGALMIGDFADPRSQTRM
jgi:hypothetical protein